MLKPYLCLLITVTFSTPTPDYNSYHLQDFQIARSSEEVTRFQPSACESTPRIFLQSEMAADRLFIWRRFCVDSVTESFLPMHAQWVHPLVWCSADHNRNTLSGASALVQSLSAT